MTHSGATHFTCRKCPDLLVPKEEVEAHREWHRRQRKLRPRKPQPADGKSLFSVVRPDKPAEKPKKSKRSSAARQKAAKDKYIKDLPNADPSGNNGG